MVFQYNPLHPLHGDQRERRGRGHGEPLDLLSPRIRYNVHDEGGVARYRRIERVLHDHGYELRRLGEMAEAHGPRGPLPWTEPVPLPFLWIFGPPDATVSIMGANVYPEDVEASIYAAPELAAAVRAFQLALLTDGSDNPRPGVLLKMNEGAEVSESWREQCAERIRDGAAALSRDYRTSLEEYPAAMQPIVRTYALGTGPFAADADRIEQRRIARD